MFGNLFGAAGSANLIVPGNTKRCKIHGNNEVEVDCIGYMYCIVQVHVHTYLRRIF